MAYPAETHDGTVTSWIPLTTPYSVPASCSTYFRWEEPSLVAFDPGYGLQINSNVNCQPSAVTTWWEQGLFGVGDSGHTVVSIGPLTCPHGWSSVVTVVTHQSSTQAMCCPDRYTLGNGEPGSIAGNCQSPVTNGQVITFASTSDDNTQSWSIATTTVSGSSFVGAIAIVGWNIAMTSTISSSTSPTPISTSISSATSTSSEPGSFITPASSTMAPTSSGLSKDASIGIGVGIGLGVLAIAVIVFLLLWLRRSKRKDRVENKTSPTGKVEPNLDHYAKKPYSSFNAGAASVSATRTELQSDTIIFEMDTPKNPIELDNSPKLPAELSSERF